VVGREVPSRVCFLLWSSARASAFSASGLAFSCPSSARQRSDTRSFHAIDHTTHAREREQASWWRERKSASSPCVLIHLKGPYLAVWRASQAKWYRMRKTSIAFDVEACVNALASIFLFPREPVQSVRSDKLSAGLASLCWMRHPPCVS
jgi:hypothetical protein